MTITVPTLIVLVVIAFICGAVGKALAGGAPGGLITSIALGFIGALFGPWIARQLNLAEPFMLQLSGPRLSNRVVDRRGRAGRGDSSPDPRTRISQNLSPRSAMIAPMARDLSVARNSSTSEKETQ
jgi:uncharacterized membrane protein YeaQ/YmgE (transglycosylase-associated protein family)